MLVIGYGSFGTIIDPIYGSYIQGLVSLGLFDPRNGIEGLSQKVGDQVPFYDAQRSRRPRNSEDLKELRA